jgi:hypothetical protein
MRKILITFISFAVFAISFATFRPNQETSVFKIDHLFFAQGSYIFVHPPQQIAAGSISAPQASFDNRYIAYLNDPIANQSASFVPVNGNDNDEIDPGPRRSAYLYDLKLGKSTQILNLEGANIKPTKFQWLPFSPYLYIEYQRDQRAVRFLIDANNLTKTFLPAVPNSEREDALWFIASMNEVVQINSIDNEDQNESLLIFTNIKSGSQRSLSIPGPSFYDFWSDGKNLFVGRPDYYSVSTENGENNQIQVDLKTGKMIPGKAKMDYTIDTYRVDVQANDCSISGEYLDNPGEPKFADFETTLSTEGVAGGATFDRKFAFYSTRSGLFLSRLEPISEKQLVQTFGPAIKAKVISAAKQVGVAAAIYCADYDDRFPLANNFKEGVMPYIKNRQLLNGFQYFMDGELATDIDSIAEKEMGMIQTPLGTAIVYADTHVKWRNWNAPPSKVQF